MELLRHAFAPQTEGGNTALLDETCLLFPLSRPEPADDAAEAEHPAPPAGDEAFAPRWWPGEDFSLQ